MHTNYKKATSYFFKNFIFIFLMVLLFYLVISYSTQKTEMMKEKVVRNETSVVTSASSLIASEFNAMITDLDFIHLSVIGDIEDVKVEEQLLINYASTHSYVDQIRVIDENGYEQYRVDNEPVGTIVVEEENLQYKGEKYYYEKTVGLKDGEIFVSRMDLNMENGEIELPIKPMVRIGTPLYIDDKFEGIAIINIKVDELLDNVAELFELSEGAIFVVDREGNYIQSSIDPSKEFSFMYDEKDEGQFSDDYKEFWSYLESNPEAGDTFNDEGVFSYSQIASEGQLEDDRIELERNIYIVSYIPKGNEIVEAFYMDLDEYIYSAISTNDNAIVLLIIISFVISLLLTVSRNASNKANFYASYDVMTKAYNRRKGFELISQHFEEYKKSIDKSQNSCIGYVDIDNLKTVNDTHGHTEGDKLIINISTIIQNHLGKNHLFIRYGGDEFLLLFKYESTYYAENIMKEIELEFDRINEENENKYKMSMSYGIVDLKDETEDIDDLIKLADQLMYENKQEKKREMI